MGHGPATKWGEDKSIPLKIKLGLWMFSFYILLYGGFIVINVIGTIISITFYYLALN